MWCTVVLVSMWCTNSVFLLVQQQELIPFFYVASKNFKFKNTLSHNLHLSTSELSFLPYIFPDFSLWPFHKAKYLSHASSPGGIPLEKIRGNIAWTDFTITHKWGLITLLGSDDWTVLALHTLLIIRLLKYFDPSFNIAGDTLDAFSRPAKTH